MSSTRQPLTFDVGVGSIAWGLSGFVWLSIGVGEAARGAGIVLVGVLLGASVAMFMVAVTAESSRRSRVLRLAEVTAQLEASEERLRRAVYGG